MSGNIQEADHELMTVEPRPGARHIEQNQDMEQSQANLISMDVEDHKFHKYLDRILEIMEGRNKKLKRNSVSSFCPKKVQYV